MKVASAIRTAKWRAINVTTRAARTVVAASVPTSKFGMRAWRLTLSTPVIPADLRAKVAGVLHGRLLAAGHPPSAAREVTGKAASATRLAVAELANGYTPSDFTQVLAGELAAADAAYGRGEMSSAARSLSSALDFAFHRALHIDQLTSPLAADPAGYLAPLHQSKAARAANGHIRLTPAVPAPQDRPLRLLLAYNGNSNFLGELRRHYGARPDVEVRLLDIAADPTGRELVGRRGWMLEHQLCGDSAYGDAVENWLRPHLDWADTVFIDWCDQAAVLCTLVDPGTTRIILRIHSYELLSPWPHMVSFGRIDDVVFVSELTRELGASVIPGPPRRHVIPNAVEPAPYARPKSADARFTLGLIGGGAVVKDPRWAVAILRLLRREDSRYRLLIFGGEIDPGFSAAARDYRDLLKRDLESVDGVEQRGYTTDVPAALTEIGVILSTSVRESFHLALVEGAASQAVPVVRDWPFFAAQTHGARSLFPADWVVATPEDAAKRILEATTDEAVWRSAGEQAAAYVQQTWDWPVTARRFDEMLLRQASS